MNKMLSTVFDSLRKYSQVASGLGLGVVFSVSYLPEGSFAHRLGRFHQLYEAGVPVPLDSHTESLKEQVLDKVNLKPEVEVDVLVIPTFSPDPIHRGSTKTHGGSLIGLPANFRYRSLDDIEKSRLLAGGKTLDWAKSTTQSFANSLILSDDAKKFVIGRQIGEVDTWQVMNKPLLASVAFIGSYTIGYMLNELYSLRRRIPLKYRVFLYSVWGGVGVIFYTLSFDSYRCYLDRYSDRYSARLGQEFARGGVEYYQKLLQRNRALRELVPDGDKYYTQFGNLVATWRQPSLPITQRLDNLKAELAKYTVDTDVKQKEEECVYCK